MNIWQDLDLWLEKPVLVEDDLIIKEVRLEKNLKHCFLLCTKFIPHITAFLYIIYTFLGFCGIDAVIISYFAHVSFLSMCYIFINSIVYKFCYVHRLPLYYIATNELITVTDNYYQIPLNDFHLLVFHIIIIGILIFGYTFYYIKR